MFFQCTYCDISGKSYSDPIFNPCKANHHEILEMLEENNLTEKTKNTEEEAKAKGIEFALNPHILEEWKKDLDRVHVGDEKNKVLLGILLASSKRKGHEQAVIIQKQSSAGGSNLQNSLLQYFDNKITFTRMTGAYLDRSNADYNGKILAIGEMAGFDSASSSLRQKLSEGGTALATTNRDEKGKIMTEILTTEGRPSLITTTTSLEIHPEFENRCWIVGIDETAKQTKAVNKHQFAKDTFEYEEWRPKADIKALLNSDLLEDHRIVNLFAGVLGENFPHDNVTARRDSKRFADLTTTITYLYQYQRIKIKTKNQFFILTSYEDIKLSLFYGQDALKNTLNKLNEKSESVIEYMKANRNQEFFTRNELCEALSIPYETMKRILTKLVGRSFVEVVDVDRVWKYRLSNKAIIEGIPVGLEADFQRIALEYLAKHSSCFEQIILPPDYTIATGVDRAIVDYLLSLNCLVTGQNGDIICTKIVPVTTLPIVRVTGTANSDRTNPITRGDEKEP